MLKKYRRPNELWYVGKNWEIRYALRRAVKQYGGQTKLSQFLRK